MSAAPLVPYENAVRFHTRSHGLALLCGQCFCQTKPCAYRVFFRAIAWRKWALHTIPLAFSNPLRCTLKAPFSTRFLPVLPHTACDPNRASHSLLQASFWAPRSEAKSPSMAGGSGGVIPMKCVFCIYFCVIFRVTLLFFP